jgi:hypothetical protein
MMPRIRLRFALSLVLLLLISGLQANAAERGFTDLFDGRTLNGWTLIGGHGPGYIVRDGMIVCPADGGGNLMTEKEYGDFVLRLEFQFEKGGNNGIGIRAPLSGDVAYSGMEVQVLDDYDAMYANLQPGQYCGSIYKVAPARRGALKQAGEWNQEEIRAVGRHVTIKLNGKTIVDADLNEVTDPATLLEHPGMRRDRGHVGFLGHGPVEVRFRNIRIRDLTKPEKDNTPPDGFKPLFNGRDLSGWKGLLAGPNDNPAVRAKLTPEQLATAQAAADNSMREHWKVVDGALQFDGKGLSLATGKDYGDFEMLVDWKILPQGDSGIYLRGAPQVQIWDNPLGSGGLYNNQKNPSNPSKRADKPVGEWNRFRILMVGDKVTVHLNDELVTNAVTMENYWERDKPIYPVGQIELQNHGNTLWFKNVYIRELPRK